MSFDWSQYLDLALELYEQAGRSGHRDANFRSSISRAYYATYHKSRQLLKTKWGISIAEDSNAHRQVQKEFAEKKQDNIAYNLHRMRVYRNNADYKDENVNLEKLAQENINRAKRVLSDLRSV